MADLSKDSQDSVKNFSERIEWANYFLSRGYAIFPIDPQSKKPVIREWQKYSTQKLPEEEKAKYLEMIKNGHNYAVPGGQNGLVILDFEDRELLKNWLGKDLDEICKRTLCVITPHNGLHIYVKSNEIPEHKFNPLFINSENKGIADLQSFNSYVLGPESCINHKFCNSEKCPWKGQDYTTCYIPLNANEIQSMNLKDLLRTLAEKGKRLGIRLSPSAHEWVYGTEEKKEETDEKYKKLIDELKENDSGIPIEKFKKKFCEEKSDTIEYEVICEGKTYHDAGIDRSRGDWRVIRFLLRNGITDPDKILQLLPPDSKAKENEKWDTKKYFLHTLEKAWNITKKFRKAEQKIRLAKSEREKKEIVEQVLSDIIMSHEKIVTFYTINSTSDSIVGVFRWNRKKGIFEPYENRLRRLIREMIDEWGLSSKNVFIRASKSLIDNIFNEIRDKTLRPMPQEPLRIAFKNVTLEWDKDKPILIFERTPDKFSFHYIPHKIRINELTEFSKKAMEKGDITIEDIEELARRICPKSLQAFKDWVGEKWILLFEIIGYILYPAIKFKKAFMLLGNTDAGKTTFLNLIKKLLGHHEWSAVSLIELLDLDNKFALSELYMKLVNLSSEVGDYSIDNVDLFKKITGGDPVSADVKFKNRITFTPYAKIVVASNKLPSIPGKRRDDDAFWRRWIIIEFPNKFKNDDAWFNETFTEEELEGILTVSIIAITRVFKYGRFDYEQTIDQVKDSWLSQTDSVYRFIQEMKNEGVIVVDPSNGDWYVKIGDLYNKYKEYCYLNGIATVGVRSFVNRVKRYLQVKTGTKRIKKEDGSEGKIRVFLGIKVNENNEAPENHGERSVVDEIREFIEYVIRNNNVIKEFREIVQDFNNDMDKANRFVEWCKEKRFCDPRGVDAFELHL